MLLSFVKDAFFKKNLESICELLVLVRLRTGVACESPEIVHACIHKYMFLLGEDIKYFSDSQGFMTYKNLKTIALELHFGLYV